MFDIIHVGYPKAGSSWLQSMFFPKIPNVNFISKPGIIREYLSYVDDLFYNTDKVRSVIAPMLDDSAINILSHETILKWTPNFNISRNCRRLKDLSPNAKILIVIRNQKDAMHSHYKTQIRLGHGFTFGQYVDRSFECNHVYGLDYDSVIGMYERSFDNVHTVLFEEMFSADVINDILHFVGIETPDPVSGIIKVSKVVNRGLKSPISWQLMRLLNKTTGTKLQRFEERWFNFAGQKLIAFFDRFLNRFSYSRKINYDKEDRRIEDYFKESNKRLQKRYDSDIRELGYVF